MSAKTEDENVLEVHFILSTGACNTTLGQIAQQTEEFYPL